MTEHSTAGVDYQVVHLAGRRYAILPERALQAVCRRAEVPARPANADTEALPVRASVELDTTKLAQRLIERRRRAGLTQAELARRAGVRAETLNRIERGRTTPDFATVRRLVEAINAAEAAAELASLEMNT